MMDLRQVSHGTAMELSQWVALFAHNQRTPTPCRDVQKKLVCHLHQMEEMSVTDGSCSRCFHQAQFCDNLMISNTPYHHVHCI